MTKITKKFVEENLEEIKKFIPQEQVQKEEIGIIIKNRWTGSIIFESSKTTWREAIEEAKNDINLTGADLTGADLTGCLFYFGSGFANFAALCRAIRTIKHKNGKFEDFDSNHISE